MMAPGLRMHFVDDVFLFSSLDPEFQFAVGRLTTECETVEIRQTFYSSLIIINDQSELIMIASSLSLDHRSLCLVQLAVFPY